LLLLIGGKVDVVRTSLLRTTRVTGMSSTNTRERSSWDGVSDDRRSLVVVLKTKWFERGAKAWNQEAIRL